MVRQVQVVAILMIVNGAIVSLMGLLYLVMGPAMFAIMSAAPSSPAGASQADTVMATVLSVFYVVIGLLVLASSVLNIVGGIRSLRLRGRSLAIVALFSNLAPMFTCYCIPTSLGLMIYGLIVFFQADVAYAFAAVASGAPPERFTRSRPQYDRYDEEEVDDLPPLSPRRGGENIQVDRDDFHRRPQRDD